MTAAEPRLYRAGEFHRFEAAGHEFLYLVPAGAIFELDDDARSVIDILNGGTLAHDRLLHEVTSRGMTPADAGELIEELYQSRAIVTERSLPEAPIEAPDNFPLQSLVMNLTNQCNLSCQYCYEFGEDKVATPEGKPKFMDLETAKASVDFLLSNSAGRRGVHITFFGGETLMNFPLLQQVVTYATEQASLQGRTVDFSLTTNATLLTPAIIQFLSENRIGVTVSMDG
ncbi:MAG TPA: radical SAM protein, partial [Bryobacteraceae bacterium]|nr:radical SAM protein [Bryobacteraceae bacterium]